VRIGLRVSATLHILACTRQGAKSTRICPKHMCCFLAERETQKYREQQQLLVLFGDVS